MFPISVAPKDRAILTVLSSVTVIGALLTSEFVLKTDADKFFVNEKAYELTTNFFFATVLGGGLVSIYRLWEGRRAEERRKQEEDRDRRLAQRLLLREFFGSVVNIHHEYKKIRRTFRANSFQEQGILYIERMNYEYLMDRLEDCHLKTENVRRQVLAQAELFGEDRKILPDILKNIDDYLRALLREYESNYFDRRNMNVHELMIVSPPLREFIGGNKKNRDVPIGKNAYITTEQDIFKLVDLSRKLILRLIATNASHEMGVPIN